MNVLIKRSSLILLTNWMQRILLTAGILAIGYCGFVLIDTWNFERRVNRQLERSMADQRASESEIQATASSAQSAAVGADGLIGRIEVSRIGLSAMIIEGTSNKTLRRAAGHIAGTALPGQLGNAGIAGHRDRFFRPLRNIRMDDFITITTPGKLYRYRVIWAKVVGPNDVDVLAPDGTEVLTLVTCYPFYFVGAAPDRFIVRAERVKS